MRVLDDHKKDIIQRNIPEAMRVADAAEVKHRKEYGNLKTFEGWDAVYHREMDKLCKKDGVRV
jgi:hypothetical protein